LQSPRIFPTSRSAWSCHSPAGSGTDILARIVTEEMRTSMGANFVIDNRAGASGQIGAELVARANPDGYTLFLSTNTPHSANPFLFKKINYDPIKDFAAVSRMIYYVFILVVNPNAGIKTVPELITYVKANPARFRTRSATARGRSTARISRARRNSMRCRFRTRARRRR
jgi:tripartite-type tricarboxylate transporter receptor subunit TctC